jgi:acyl-CoA synthetase (AMP-forming)/AMP-acid ligase II
MSNFIAKLRQNSKRFAAKPAIVDMKGGYTYSRLLGSAEHFASSTLRPLLNDRAETKVAYLNNRDATYVLSQLATWKAGACCIPLSTLNTQAEIEYYLADSQADVVVCSP